MDLAITAAEAMWFSPFVVPICFYVAFSDMRAMKIPNHSVIALFTVFVLVGLIALPVADWAWRLLHMVVVLIFGMMLNAGGAIGAGDAKFAAAAAPFIVLPDLVFVLILFSATLLAAFAIHRIAKYSPLRRLAPDWESWQTGSDFPMGLALGGVLAIYLCLGMIYGSG